MSRILSRLRLLLIMSAIQVFLIVVAREFRLTLLGNRKGIDISFKAK